MRTGVIFVSPAFLNVAVGVFLPLTSRNWSTSCDRAVFH